MKRTFPCGHSGKGQYCHACAAKEKEKERATQAKLLKMKAACDDPIDLSALNHLPATQNKARNILRKIQSGEDYRQFNGKTLHSQNHEVLSVPVGDHYRLLFVANTLQPLFVIHHERYNTLARTGVNKMRLSSLRAN